jgi:hypothetical protein
MHGSSGRVPAKQVQTPDFKPSTAKKIKKEEEEKKDLPRVVAISSLMPFSSLTHSCVSKFSESFKGRNSGKCIVKCNQTDPIEKHLTFLLSHTNSFISK